MILFPVSHVSCHIAILQDEEDELLKLLASVRSEMGPDAPDESDFKAISKGWRRSAYMWCQKPLLVMSDLTFLRLALGPQCALMAQHLKVSSEEWDQQQVLKDLQNGIRDYRILWAYRSTATVKAICDVCSLILTDFTCSMPTSMMTQGHLSLLLRMLCRTAAAVYYYLGVRHRRYPWKVFALLSDDANVVKQAKEDILHDYSHQRCVMDAFTLWVLAPHIDTEGRLDLKSKGAMLVGELRAIAATASIDIAAIECAHASNRRLVESKSLQTHAANLAGASCHFIGRMLRKTTALGFPCHPSSVKVPQKRGRKPMKAKPVRKHFKAHLAAGKALRRGGGAWNAFLAVKKLPPPITDKGKKAHRAAKAEYRRLSSDELARFQALGHARTSAAKYGGQKSQTAAALYKKRMSNAPWQLWLWPLALGSSKES